MTLKSAEVRRPGHQQRVQGEGSSRSSAGGRSPSDLEYLADQGERVERNEGRIVDLSISDQIAGISPAYHYRTTPGRKMKALLSVGGVLFGYSILPKPLRDIADYVVMPLVVGTSAVTLTYLAISGLDATYERLARLLNRRR